jgi:hypothetical protein
MFLEPILMIPDVAVKKEIQEIGKAAAHTGFSFF